jgi:hypothetical protein
MIQGRGTLWAAALVTLCTCSMDGYYTGARDAVADVPIDDGPHGEDTRDADVRGGDADVPRDEGAPPDDGPCVDVGPAPSCGSDGGVVAPRLLAPLSTQTVNTPRPRLCVEVPRGASAITVEIVEAARAADMRAWTTVAQDGPDAGLGLHCARPAEPRSEGVHFWRARASLAGSAVSSQTWEFRVPRRPSGWTPREGAWGTLPDFDRDGLADVAVSHRNEGFQPYEGFVRIYRGVQGSLPSLWSSHSLRNEGYGKTVASAGDVNGDGYADLVVASNDGVYLSLSNGSRGVSAASPVRGAFVRGNEAPVASAGDVDHDGYGDIVVGRLNMCGSFTATLAETRPNAWMRAEGQRTR